MACTVVASSTRPPLPDHHHLHRRPVARRGAHATRGSTGPRGDQLYVRLDPLAGGTGGGGAQNAGGNTRQLVEPSEATSCRSRSNTNTTTQRGQPRLRGADVRGARVLARLLERERRLRRHRQRRPDDARLRPLAHRRYTDAPNGHVALTAELALAPRSRARPRARLRHAPQAARDRPPPAAVGQRFGAAWPRYERAVAALRRRLRRPARRARLRRDPRVLRVGQRRQGQRGQDVPRRDRRRARVAVGPGGPRRRRSRRQADVLRLLPRGVRAGPVRGVRRAAGRRRHRHRAGRDALPVRAPAAGRRLDAAQLAAQRQGRARTPAASSSTRPRTRS